MTWWKLPKSGVLFFSKTSPGGGALETDAPGTAALDTSGTPISLDGKVEDIVRRLEGSDVATIQALLRDEHAGRNRTTLISQLEQMRDKAISSDTDNED